MDPVVLFFLLGVFAKLAKSDLRLPEALYETLSIFLLLAIGLKGGVELAKVPFASVAVQASAVVVMGFLLPLPAFAILRGLGRLPRPDAASIAAHYGSVSVVTFAVATAYLAKHNIEFEAHMPLFVALLETPAIVTGILLARLGTLQAVRWGAVLHEVMFGKTLVLLLGGLAIGAAVGPEGIAPIKPLFIDLFKGVLAVFLLEMGLVAGGRLGDLRRAGLFLAAFGVVVPLCFACVGALVARAVGLSDGGTALLATMAASASYIAAPTAMRIAVPEANPALSIGVALGITFPFNITLGIPLYLRLAESLRF
ncbi:MAG: sodium-dependent bicarbonate transport family permease [Betaproteobacteria bacterium]